MTKIETKVLKISKIKPNPKNPKKHWVEKISESIKEMGYIEPIVVDENNMILAGHGRKKALEQNGVGEVEVIVKRGLTEEQKEKYMLLSNKIVESGGWNFDLLAEFDEQILADAGFSSEDLDEIFGIDENSEIFDLARELKKLEITKINIKKGDVFQFPEGSKIMCGDSTKEDDVLKLMGKDKADMVMTDPPYRLKYLMGKKRNGKATEGFGLKRNRKYLETDELPENFTELWMANVAKVANKDFSIICYENWKNLREIWNTMEKHWRVRNMLIWHTPNRNQGFAGKYKFFSKYDFAMLGTSQERVELNLKPETEVLQNEFEAALYATTGSPHWESYKKGKKYCPTDLITYNTADEKSSGQGIIFGVKPVEILIPYIKVLTRRGDLVLEPFGGSGSSAVAAIKLKRRFCLMEKSPVYTAVTLRRLEKLFGVKPKKL